MGSQLFLKKERASNAVKILYGKDKLPTYFPGATFVRVRKLADLKDTPEDNFATAEGIKTFLENEGQIDSYKKLYLHAGKIAEKSYAEMQENK